MCLKSISSIRLFALKDEQNPAKRVLRKIIYAAFWGGVRLESRVGLQNSTMPGQIKEAYGKCGKLLTVGKAIDAIEEHIKSNSAPDSAALLHHRYSSKSIGEKMQFRGDGPILGRISQSKTDFDVILSMLCSIRAEIGNFHRMRRLGDLNVSRFQSLVLVCVLLGTSRIFGDVLDVCVHDSTPSAHHQICRSMRKVEFISMGCIIFATPGHHAQART